MKTLNEVQEECAQKLDMDGKMSAVRPNLRDCERRSIRKGSSTQRGAHSGI
jgi:hypothetical protein